MTTTRLTVADLTTTARIETRPGGEIAVSAIHSGGLDRPKGYTMILPATKMALARRLARAIDAGAVYGPHAILTDINGNTFATYHHTQAVRARCLNADLRKIGF